MWFVELPTIERWRCRLASMSKKARLQAFVEKIHAAWPMDRDYMAPPTKGELAALDPALFVTPPTGLEVGYVPIITRQEAVSD